MDLTALSTEELDQHRSDVLAELERRASLAIIPGQISDLRDKYVTGGGDLGDLQ